MHTSNEDVELYFGPVSDEPTIGQIQLANPDYYPSSNKSKRHVMNEFIYTSAIVHNSDEYGWRLGNLSTHQDNLLPTNLKPTFLYHKVENKNGKSPGVVTEAALVLIEALSSIFCGSGGYEDNTENCICGVGYYLGHIGSLA